MKKLLSFFLPLLVTFSLFSSAQALSFAYSTTHKDVVAIGHQIAKEMEKTSIPEEFVAEVEILIENLPDSAAQWQLQSARYLLRHYNILLNITKAEEKFDEKENLAEADKCSKDFEDGCALLDQVKSKVSAFAAAMRQPDSMNNRSFIAEQVSFFNKAEQKYKTGHATKKNEKKAKSARCSEAITIGFVIGSMVIILAATTWGHARRPYDIRYRGVHNPPRTLDLFHPNYAAPAAPYDPPPTYFSLRPPALSTTVFIAPTTAPGFCGGMPPASLPGADLHSAYSF